MDIKKEIKNIIERNKRVEADKAWEVSWTRKIFVTLTTYIIMVLTMFFLGLENPFIGAIIPTLGFLLSTLTIGFVKKFWIKRVYK